VRRLERDTLRGFLRTLALPAFLVSELQTHLDRFATHGELVFAGRDGGPMRRTNFRRRIWLSAVESVGLTPLRFHDLRHTAAALMISQGAHPKLFQSRLGHSSIQVTFDVYGHLLPALDEELARGLDAARSEALSEISATYLLHAEDQGT
jgi:integrase